MARLMKKDLGCFGDVEGGSNPILRRYAFLFIVRAHQIFRMLVYCITAMHARFLMHDAVPMTVCQICTPPSEKEIGDEAERFPCECDATHALNSSVDRPSIVGSHLPKNIHAD